MLVRLPGKMVAGGKHHPRAVQVDVGPAHTFQGDLEIGFDPHRECTRSPEVEARGEGTDSEPQGRRLLARPAIDRARIRGIKMIVVFFTLHEIARHPGAREQPDPARTKDIEGYGD